MNHSIQKFARHLVAVSIVLWTSAIMAEFKLEMPKDDSSFCLRVGGDLRARYEGYTANVAQPDADKAGRHATEYLRVRTRVWTALDFGEDITLNLRLTNRVHKVTTSPNRKNNNGTSTWEFPDETVLDSANVVFRNLVDGRLELTIGRQDFSLGNGLIFSEGTPFDQGRTQYCDGAVAKYKDGKEEVRVFSFYDSWKDRFVGINDRNRRLRSGNIFTAGFQWTHDFCDALKGDAYYVFQDVDDKQPLEAERGHYADSSASIHTVGLRAFGKPSEWFDYSLEAAHQAGRDCDDELLDAWMADARVNFHLADESKLKPVLTLNFTHFSGDDQDSRRNEGWIPLMSQCPLWGEELVPIMLNGYWSNINSMRCAFAISPIERLKFTVSVTEYLADEKDARIPVQGTGDGRRFGTLLNVAASYKFTDTFSVQGQFSHFIAGNYFANGHDSNWGRLELTQVF